MEMSSSPKLSPRSSASFSFSLMKLIVTLVVVFLLGWTAGIYFSNGDDGSGSSSGSESLTANEGTLPGQHNRHIRKHKSPFMSNNGLTEDPFILSIVVQFNSLEGLTHFKELFAPMALWVKQHEPTTTSYALASSDKEPLQVLVFEQYVSKHAYLEIHRKSEQFLVFKQSLLAMNEEAVEAKLGWKMNGQSYRQPIVGFI